MGRHPPAPHHRAPPLTNITAAARQHCRFDTPVQDGNGVLLDRLSPVSPSGTPHDSSLAIGSDDMLQPTARSGAVATPAVHPDGPVVQFIHPQRGPAGGGTVVSVRGRNLGAGLHEIVQLECGGHDVRGTATYVS